MQNDFNITKLRRMIELPGCSEAGKCFLTDEQLLTLLELYPCYELAAYHACLMMAQRTDMRLSDGTDIPDQSVYWLRRAISFRPNSGGSLCRADEVSA